MTRARQSNLLVSACIEALTLQGAYVWRNNTGATRIGDRYIAYGAKGSPDIIGVMPDGRFVGVECKSGRGRLTVEQKAFIEGISSRGGLAIVARTVDDVIDGIHGTSPARVTRASLTEDA